MCISLYCTFYSNVLVYTWVIHDLRLRSLHCANVYQAVSKRCRVIGLLVDNPSFSCQRSSGSGSTISLDMLSSRSFRFACLLIGYISAYVNAAGTPRHEQCREERVLSTFIDKNILQKHKTNDSLSRWGVLGPTNAKQGTFLRKEEHSQSIYVAITSSLALFEGLVAESRTQLTPAS